MSTEEIDYRVVRKLLGLFNRAAIAQDISGHHLNKRPDPASRHHGIIGDVVAQAIINKRNILPGMRFKELRELDNIKGMSHGKLRLLLDNLAVPAAEAFRTSIYESVLRESWILEHHSVRFEDEEQFLHVVSDTEVFLDWVEGQACIVARDRTRDNRNHSKVRAMLLRSPLEVYDGNDVAAHAFALWLYKITADSWFSYEAVQRETAAYLDFMQDFLERTELCMFQGFKNQNLLTGPITNTGLPVTVNYCEQTISLWTVQVID